MSSLIDETARWLTADDDLADRRRFLGRASGVVLSLLGFGLLAGTARAEDYCFKQCEKAAADQLSGLKEQLKAEVLKKFSNEGSLISLSDVVRQLAGDYSDYYEDRGLCRLENCGDPTKYPKPPVTQLPPGKKCNPLISCHCGFADCSIGSYCGVCSGVNGNAICCYSADVKPNGNSVCCPN